MANVEQIDDYRVVIKGTTYSILDIPPERSAIVQEQTGAILKSLSLDAIVEGLEKSDGLLRCAYNGVAGKGALRAAVMGLQHDLKEACSKTLLALGEFETQSTEVLENMNQMFRNLVKPGKVELALDYLAACSEAARNLSERAAELAKEFHDLAAKTVTTAQDTEKEKGLTEAQQHEFERQAGDLKAKIAEADEQTRQLTELCQNLQKRYEDAHASAEKEADRAFAIGMVGAIMKPLAAGLGSAAAAYGASRTGGFTAAATAAANVTRPGGAPQGGTEQSSGAAGETSETESETQPESDGSSAKATEDQTATSEPKPDANAGKKAALEGAAATASESAESLTKLSDKLDERAKGARDLEMEILRMQQQVQTSRITQAGLLAKFAIELTNVKDATRITAATVYSLYIAIGALKKVANVLDDAALFWEQMQRFCSALNSGGFQAKVAILKKYPDDMIDAFRTDNATKKSVVVYYASWMAISQVTKAYQVKAAAVRETMKKHFEENLSTQDSMAMARQLGNQLYLDMEVEIKDATADREEIGKQLATAPKAA
jgi:hypothetical protein